ncbi:MAG: hypothetical protein ACNI27_10035 [Desulfovibrio sp.]
MSDVDLKDLTKEDLLEHMEGGVYSLLAEEEEFEELQLMTMALGVKYFIENCMEGKSMDELVELFGKGEYVIGELVTFAEEKGLVDLSDDDEDEEGEA